MTSRFVARVRDRSFAERYLATAAIVWLLYGSLSAALLHTGLPTWLAGGFAYALALLVHFSLHRFLVFEPGELEYHHDLTTQVWRYLTTAAAQYAFTLAGTAFIVGQTSLHRSVAYVGCAGFAAVLNFLALKLLVFPHAADAADVVGQPASEHKATATRRFGAGRGAESTDMSMAAREPEHADATR